VELLEVKLEELLRKSKAKTIEETKPSVENVATN